MQPNGLAGQFALPLFAKTLIHTRILKKIFFISAGRQKKIWSEINQLLNRFDHILAQMYI